MDWDGPSYPDYQGYAKVSGKENTSYDAQSQESAFLMQMMKTQFGEQQGLLNNVLIPQLTQTATNPHQSSLRKTRFHFLRVVVGVKSRSDS